MGAIKIRSTYARRGRNYRIWFKPALHVALAFIAVLGLLNLFSNHNLHEEQKSESLPTVRKVTMLYGNRTMYDRALKTHEAHSHKFGYPMTVLRKPILGGLWSKPAIILSTLIEEMGKSEEQRVQWLFWFDADTILMNPNIPLETFLPPPQFSETHLLLTKDWNGMNNGVFFLRVHPWSIEFFSAIVSYPVIHPDAHLLWEDQSVMNRLKKEHEYFSRSMVYCPLRWFNAYKRNQNVTDINPKKPIHFQIHPGDIIVHFPGTPANELESTMLPYLEVAESHNPEWELPLEQTGYLREIAELWDEMSES